MSRAANRPEPHHYAKKQPRRQWRNLLGVYSWLPPVRYRKTSLGLAASSLILALPALLLKVPEIGQRDHD